MSSAIGARRFLAIKGQTAHGTKATGMTMSVAPLRTGSIFKVNPLLQARADAINTMLRFADFYPVPAIVPWQASFYLQNPTTAHSMLRDLLRTFHGKETVLAGPPLTKQYDVFDDVIDGGVDGTPVNVVYGRGLTLHEEAQNTAGGKIYAHEVQDAVIEDIEITWIPNGALQIDLSGMASDLQDDQATVTPVYPDGSLFHFQHVRDTTTSGLRIGTANPPVAADNTIFSKGVLNLSQKVRYLPFLGNGSTKQVRKPIRDDQLQVSMDVTMDVEDTQANQYDSFDAWGHWKNKTPLNLDFFTYIDANNILEYKASAAVKACFWETMEQTAQGFGAMQWQGKLRIVPNALTDAFMKFTTVS